MKMSQRTVCVGGSEYAPARDNAEPVVPSLIHGAGGHGHERDGVTATDRPVLIVIGGPDDGAAVPIAKRTITMGRLPDNDVVINEPGVSRRHAEIVGTVRGYYLRDVGIPNRTFVNGRDIEGTEHPLSEGDRIRLALSNVSLVFSYCRPLTPEESGSSCGETKESAPEGPWDAVVTTEPAAYGLMPLAEVDGAANAPPQPLDDAVYEGAVLLDVEPEGDIQLVALFVRELRQTPQLWLRRLEGNHEQVEILLALREPVRLEEMIADMKGVIQVSPRQERQDSPVSHDRVLGVRLAGSSPPARRL